MTGEELLQAKQELRRENWIDWLQKQGVGFICLCAVVWWVSENYIKPDLADKREYIKAQSEATRLMKTSVDNQTTAVQTLQNQQIQVIELLRQIRNDQREGAWNRPKPDGTTAGGPN